MSQPRLEATITIDGKTHCKYTLHRRESRHVDVTYEEGDSVQQFQVGPISYSMPDLVLAACVMQRVVTRCNITEPVCTEEVSCE